MTFGAFGLGSNLNYKALVVDFQFIHTTSRKTMMLFREKQNIQKFLYSTQNHQKCSQWWYPLSFMFTSKLSIILSQWAWFSMWTTKNKQSHWFLIKPRPSIMRRSTAVHRLIHYFNRGGCRPSGIHHWKYCMPIHYDTIEGGQNKTSHRLFSNWLVMVGSKGHRLHD